MKNHPYPELPANPDFPALEREVLGFWKEARVFEASVEARPKEVDGKTNAFVFYDGPPFANGLPHYGHLLTGYVKDVVARYQTMLGKRVERRFGWDCHGLPAEMGAEKELELSGRQAIIDYGIGRFNDYCRANVMRYADAWRQYVERQARWVDMENDYKTMDRDYMESVIWAFKQFYDKGLIYEAFRVLPYSWGAETPLSSFETRLDNATREKVDKAVTVAFELEERPKGAPEGCRAYKILAWTTTPWTLPSNLALAASATLDYTYTIANGICYIHSAAAAKDYRKSLLDGPAMLETPRFYLREFTQADFSLFAELMADKDVNALLKPVDDPEQARSLFDAMLAQYKKDGYSKWAVFEKETNRFIGRAGVNRVAGREDIDLIEVGYILHKEFWGKGYATELARALYDWCFTGLGLENVSSLCHPENAASAKVMQKFGLQYKDDVFYPFLGDERTRYVISREDYLQKNAIKGSDLLGLTYNPLFPYFADHPNSFRILDGSDFIEEGSGTGIVHMAPGFGEDDQRVCEANGISVVCPVDGKGRYTAEIYDIAWASGPSPRPSPEGRGSSEKPSPFGRGLGEGPSAMLRLHGLNVIAETGHKDENEPYTQAQLEKYGLANLRITAWLKERGVLIRQEDYSHNYPFCWRTDTPLIYRAMPSTYIRVTAFRDHAAALNRKIDWVPSHVRDGAMGHMLNTAPDWSLSRNRFWGCPIPIWKSDNPANKELYVFGSIAELEAFFGREVTDLHRPFIDELTAPDPTDPAFTLRRVEDVMDCWFESGSMPFAQLHYPFENKEKFEQNFPADFITEYIAQTRGWFNSLIMIGAGVFDSEPFENCICHGVVIDEDGEKLSKRKGNYPDPLAVFDQFGADALRWFMMSSPIMRGAELQIDREGAFIRDAVRLYIKPLWNAYYFFTLYANADGIKGEFRTDSANPMDRYILAKLQGALAAVKSALDGYDTPGACAAISGFLELLTNWYIRRNRARFWASETSDDKGAAYNTLFTVLHSLCRAAAPLLPMVTEKIFAGLTQGGEMTQEGSVHLQLFPQELAGIDLGAEDILADMDRVRDICNAAHGVRNAENIRIRQPLHSLQIREHGFDEENEFFIEILKDEINVKKIVFNADIYDVIRWEWKLNFPIAGKRLGQDVKKAAAGMTSFSTNIKGGISNGIQLYPDEFTNTVKVLKAGAAALPGRGAIYLDLNITPDLIAEGFARDAVRLIQQSRKEADFSVSDRIHLIIDADAEIRKALETADNRDYIAAQTLAEITFGDAGHDGFIARGEIDGRPVALSLKKAA